MNLNAVFYGRYSSKMQTENSIEGQRREVEMYAKREGINIVSEYVDRARTGKNAKRTAFQKMIEDIKNCKINVNAVVVYKLDRFARSEDLHRYYEKILNDCGVVLLSATEAVNENRLGEKLMKAFTLVQNEEEVKKISQNVSRGKKEAARKCFWCGGIPPLGFDVDKYTKKLIINEDEAKIVKFAFKLRAQGFSYSYIIDNMNKRGYKTKFGRNFGKNSLFELFRNVKYKGVYEYNRAVSKSSDGKFNRHASKNEDEIIKIKDGCPRIVSDEIWDKVNEMSKKRSNIKPKGDYLLSGLVFCKCGATMQVNRRNNHNKDYVSFFCPKHKNKEGCNAKEINMETLEDFVLTQLADKLFDKKTLQNFINSFSSLHSSQIRKVKKTIQKYQLTICQNEQKIRNCVAQIENGCSDVVAKSLGSRIDELTNINKDCKRKIKRLQNNSEEIPTIEELMSLQHRFVPYMQSKVNLPMRKSYLQELIDKIIVNDDEIEVIFNL